MNLQNMSLFIKNTKSTHLINSKQLMINQKLMRNMNHINLNQLNLILKHLYHINLFLKLIKFKQHQHMFNQICQ
jgi:hypothetical protein